MSQRYEPSCRVKYPSTRNGLRQVNVRLDERSFAQLMALKEQANFSGTTGSFVRQLFRQTLNEQATTAMQW